MEITLHSEIESSMILLYILEFKEHIFKAAALSLTKVQVLSFTPDHRNKTKEFFFFIAPDFHSYLKSTNIPCVLTVDHTPPGSITSIM